MKFITRPITSEKLEQKGQSIYKLSKLGMFAGVCAIVLMVIIGLINVVRGAGFISPFIFDIYESSVYAYPFVIVGYLL